MEFIKKHKTVIFQIILTLLIGFIGNLLGGNMESFNALDKPSIVPPPIVFPIVWTILYILMAVSATMIQESDNPKKSSAMKIYYTQLAVNALWSLFFFRLMWLTFSFWWILLLIVFVVVMIYQFSKIKPLAGALQIPYLIWLLFASILNLMITMMN